MRVPTLELKNKRSGKVRIWNKSDYDPKRDSDWKVVEERSVEDMVASDNGAAKVIVAAAAPTPEPKADKVEAVADWRKMKWPAARRYIQSKTGTAPRSKQQAEDLMAAL
jgi:hypothetical protein